MVRARLALPQRAAERGRRNQDIKIQDLRGVREM
jgi:hypothetical protein